MTETISFSNVKNAHEIELYIYDLLFLYGKGKNRYFVDFETDKMVSINKDTDCRVRDVLGRHL